MIEAWLGKSTFLLNKRNAQSMYEILCVAGFVILVSSNEERPFCLAVGGTTVSGWKNDEPTVSAYSLRAYVMSRYLF